MEEFARNAVVGGVLLGLIGLLGPFRRRALVALIPLGAALGAAIGFGFRPVEPAAPLDLAALLPWLLLGITARAARPWLPRQAGVAAVLGGLVLGDLATALLLGPRCADGRTAIRVALVASGAALVSPIGTPSCVLMSTSPELVALAVALILVAWPRGELTPAEGRPAVTALLAALAVAAWFVPIWPVLGGAIVLGLVGLRDLRSTPIPWGPIAWIAGAGVVVQLVDHAGTLAEVAVGLEWLTGLMPQAMSAATFVVAVVAAALMGEGAASLAGATLLDTYVGGLPHGVVMIGLTVGGLGPVLLARGEHGLGPMWTPWLAQVVLAGLWVMLFG